MKNILRIALAVSCALVFTAITQAQTYPKVKVTLQNGMVVEGKKGSITAESVTFSSGATPQIYSLSEVSIIRAKQGKAGKWALGCGGGCAGIFLLSGVATGTEGLEEQGLSPATYAAGAMVWVGVCAGVGALIGYLLDDYENVYVNSGQNSSSLLNRFDIGFNSTQTAKYNFTLAYKLSK